MLRSEIVVFLTISIISSPVLATDPAERQKSPEQLVTEGMRTLMEASISVRIPSVTSCSGDFCLSAGSVANTGDEMIEIVKNTTISLRSMLDSYPAIYHISLKGVKHN